MAKLTPLHDRILVRRIEEGETVRGGIIIPDTAKEKPQEGEVIAVGKGKKNEEGKVFPLDVQEGDRILFGKDSYQPDEYPYYWRVFETNDEYFDYYRDYHAFWKLYGIGLPDPVLRKLYYQNALKLVPGLSHSGFTD